MVESLIPETWIRRSVGYKLPSTTLFFYVVYISCLLLLLQMIDKLLVVLWLVVFTKYICSCRIALFR